MKSLNFENDNYLNSSSVTYKRKKLEKKIEEIDTNLLTPRNNFNTYNFNQVVCTANQYTELKKVSLPKGVYEVQGFFTYEGLDLRYLLHLGNALQSVYDNSGYVNGNINNLIKVDSDSQDIILRIYVSKNVTIAYGYLKVVKLCD